MTKQSFIHIFALLLSLPACAGVTTTPDGEWKNSLAPSFGTHSCETHLKQEHLSAPDGEPTRIETTSSRRINPLFATTGLNLTRSAIKS